MVSVPCPYCEGKGELKFDREEDVIPVHHPLYGFRDDVPKKERIYICSNCGAEIHEEDYEREREMARYRKSNI